FVPLTVEPDRLRKRDSAARLSGQQAVIGDCEHRSSDLRLILEIRENGSRFPSQCQTLHIESLREQYFIPRKEQIACGNVRDVARGIYHEALFVGIKRAREDRIDAFLPGEIGGQIEVMLSVRQKHRPAMVLLSTAHIRVTDSYGCPA